MLKKYTLESTILCALIVTAFLLLSCSEKVTDPGEDHNGGNGETITISGNLQGSAGFFGKPQGTHSLPDFKIICQAATSKRIYVVTTESDGGFGFTVPGGDSYTFHILDENYFYVAPIVLAEYDQSASEVPEGMEVDDEDIDIGDVILNESDYVAVLSEGDVVTIDSSMFAAAIAGIPAGAESQGEDAANYTGHPLDLDGDGVINLMDSDDDGDGILDEFDSDWIPEAESEVVNNIGLFINFHNNLDANGDPPDTPEDHQYIITVECVVRSGEEGKIDSVSVSGPAYLDIFEIDDMGNADNWETYNGKNLVEDYLLGTSDERWGAFIRGISSAHIRDAVIPGDVWIFEVSYTDGATSYTELMAKKINFIFEDTPRNVTLNDSLWTSAAMYSLSDTVVIKWDIISSLPGMTYAVTGWPIVNGNQYGQMFGYSAGVDGDSLLFVFEDTVSAGDTIQAYNIDVVASNSHGDNAKTDGGWISKWAGP